MLPLDDPPSMASVVRPNLIFDLGFHNGDDSDYYLAKSFDVVAVEANPSLINLGHERFADAIKAGQLQLLHRAVTEGDGPIPFYVHASNSDWSSCLLDMAQSDGSEATKVIVDGVGLPALFAAYGVPRYLKVDVEGCDVAVARQLAASPIKPPFVSFETGRRDYAGIFSFLVAAGYQRFQLINQALHPTRELPAEQSEGRSIDYQFTRYSSGPFGEDLPQDKWLDADQLLYRYTLYKELKKADNVELGVGWVDVHARLDQGLAIEE
jgi:FkbM family methyltransferase